MTPPNLTKTQTNALTSDALSFTAKGLLVHLMLMPEQEASLGELALLDGSMTPDSLFRALLELETANIITKEVIRPDPFSLFPPQLMFKLLPPYTSDATDALRAYRGNHEHRVD